MQIDRRSADFSPSDSFGGFAVFDNLFYMSIISATAYVLLSSKKRKSFNIYIGLLFCVGIAMALVESRKVGLGYTFISYILTCVYFRQHITKKQISVFVSFIFFAFFIFTPIVHVHRSTLWHLPFGQKLSYIFQNYKEIISTEILKENYLEVFEKRKKRYDYFKKNILFLNRFAAIQANDDIISAVDNQGLSTSKFYLTDYTRILPSIIYPNKDTIAIGDKLRWEYNIKKYGRISFTTAPLISNAYSVGKNVGVFIVCCYIFLVTFLIVKKLSYNLHENVFAIFFLLPFIFAIHEKSHSGIILILFREIIVYIVVLYLLRVTFKKWAV